MDVHSPKQRSYNMSRIRGRDTRPELVIRRGLHARGFRFRLCARDLPGRPDLVLPKYRAAVFVNGCFWHGHDCPMFRLPATRPEFWLNKIDGTRVRDAASSAVLMSTGWRPFTVWECALRGPAKRGEVAVLDTCETFLRSNNATGEAVGTWATGRISVAHGGGCGSRGRTSPPG
jgi:DNA mismatch endonuclease (patch repair protein)